MTVVNSINKKQNIIWSSIEYIVVILAILNSVSVFYFSSNYIHNSVNYLWQLMLFILFIHSINCLKKYVINRILLFSIFFSSIILFFLIIYYFIFPYSIVSYLFIYIIDPLMLITCFMNVKDKYGLNISLLLKFEKIMIILSVISLIFWVLYSTNIYLPNMHLTVYGINSASKLTGSLSDPGYFGLDFITQGHINEFLGINNIVRNTGIFTEATMYSYMLCIALFVELFIKKTKDIFNINIFILLITIFTTTATNGIMTAIPAYLFYIFIISHNKYIKVIVLLLIPILLIFLKFVLASKAGNIDDLNSSYNIRMNDVHASIEAWKNHPIFGNGFNNISAVFQYMYGFRAITGALGSSMGFPVTLAYGGIIYGLFYLIPTILSMFYSHRICGLALFTFILFISAALGSSFIYIIILSFLWSCILSYNLKRG